MLGRYATARFASNHSPTRERGEIFLAYGDDKRKKRRIEQQEGFGTENYAEDPVQQNITHIQDTVKGDSGKFILQLAPEELRATLENAQRLMTAALEDDAAEGVILDLITENASHFQSKKPAARPEQWTPAERKEVIDAVRNHPEDSRLILEFLIQSPDRTLRMAEALHRRIERRDELITRINKNLVEKRKVLLTAGVRVGTIDQIPSDRLIALNRSNPDSINWQKLEKFLGLDTLPDPREKEIVLNMLRGALKAKRTQENLEQGALEEKQANEYWENIRNNRDALRLLFLRQTRDAAMPVVKRFQKLQDICQKQAEPLLQRKKELMALDNNDPQLPTLQQQLDPILEGIANLYEQCEPTFDSLFLKTEAWDTKMPTTSQVTVADQEFVSSDAFATQSGLWKEQLEQIEERLKGKEEQFAAGNYELRTPREIERDEKETEDWIADVSQRAKWLLESQSGWDDVTRKRLIMLAEARETHKSDFGSSTSRKLASDTLRLWEMGGPRFAVQSQETEKRLKHLEDSPFDIPMYCAEARRRLAVVGPLLQTLLPYQSLRTLRVEDRIQEKLKNIESTIWAIQNSGEKRDNPIRTGHEMPLKKLRAGAELELKALEQCAQELDGIPGMVTEIDDQEEYGKVSGSVQDSVGCFVFDGRTKKIYINGARLARIDDEEKRAEKRRRIIAHEKAHAALHILQETAFPTILFDTFDWLFKERVPGKETTTDTILSKEFQDKLLTAGEEWGLAKKEEIEAELMTDPDNHAFRKEVLRGHLGELVEKYSEWQEGKAVPETDAEQWLHEELAKRKNEVPFRPMIQHQLDREQFEKDYKNVRDDETTPPEQTAYDASADLADIRKTLTGIEDFGKANPAFKAKITHFLGNNENDPEGFWRALHRLEFMFTSGKTLELPHKEIVPAPEFNKNFKKIVGDFKKDAQELFDEINNERKKKVDPLNAVPYKNKGLLDGIRFLSIADVQIIVSELWEDITTQWKRKQQGRTADVELALTQNIPEYFKHFPGLEYTAKLKHYARRRKQNSENEAVGKWKEAMEAIEPHVLLDMLGRNPTKDQTKAIIHVLSHKGHMDWGNKNLWSALRMYSNYEMPPEAEFDDVLRDMWLRKILTDIWPDEKELFDHSKTENDSAFESGKKRYTSEADDYSNISGGMASQLERMLSLWVSHHGHPPEEVSPHRYEEFVHYAIRNGKMSMEQKMYYLVRGTAEGILSLDRLRGMAGEGGGILNAFPYIEYFSGQNSTFSEIQKLNERLKQEALDKNGNVVKDERGRPVHTFKPGNKTTLWIRLEVARNERVLQRIGKGTAKTGAENIDHEDWPWFLPTGGVSQVRNALSVISGSRQKTSPQARQNTYFGFSSVLKIFGHVIDAENQNLARLTLEDTKTLARTISGYIDYDNILTKNGTDDPKTRPSLAEYEYEAVPPAAEEGVSTRTCRMKLNEFIKEIMAYYGPGISAHENWKKVAKLKPEPGRTPEPDLTMEDVAAIKDTDKIKRNSSSIAARVAGSMEVFSQLLEEAIKRDPKGLKIALQNHAKKLPNESGSTVTKEETIKYFKMRHKMNGGGDEGGGGHP